MKAAVPILLACLCVVLFTGCGLKEKNLTRNHGVANVEINGVNSANKEEPPASAEDVVPKKEVLESNLTEAGYSVTNYSEVDENNVKADRIYAEKGKMFIDICYGLSKDDTQAVFDFYEKTYDKYYILAINGDYVYCIGDTKTFKSAGFSSLANFGTQYIYE